MEDEILPIKALSEEEIIKNNYSLNQLWMISFKEKVQGPFLESQLKKIFIENKELKNNGFQFCNLEKEKWVSLENTYFLGTDKTYSIINNNEQFTFDRIASLVQDKTIDEQILVSSDMGSTYNPLRSLQEFQFLFSRIPKLPDMISKEQFFHDKTLQIKINQKKMNANTVENLISSNKTLTSQIKNVKLPINYSNTYILSIFLFIFSAGLGYKFLNKTKQEEKFSQTNETSTKKPIVVKREVASLPLEEKQTVVLPPKKEVPRISKKVVEYGIDGEVLLNEQPVQSSQQESTPPPQQQTSQQPVSKKSNSEIEKNDNDIEDNEEE